MKLLLAKESAEIDRIAAQNGLDEITLIHNAGRRAAQIIQHYYSPCRIHILCGHGNNGSDGAVLARHLLDASFDVRLCLLDSLKHPHLWQGKSYGLDEDHRKADLIVDALFGTGLSRPLSDELSKIAENLSAPIIALDMPSGAYSDDGRCAPTVFKADITIAFVRPHPSHFLLPARAFCGKIIVANIGIPESLLEQVKTKIRLNSKPVLPALPSDVHKYQRGSVLVMGGSSKKHGSTKHGSIKNSFGKHGSGKRGSGKRGAAQLAARAALRIGAGLVTLNALDTYDHSDEAIMLESMPLKQSLQDSRRNVVLLGPGNGVNKRTKQNVLDGLGFNVQLVLDADALTCFQQEPQILFDAIAEQNHTVILTPHLGEYKRLFPDLADDTKIEQAKKAAARSGAIIILKGSDSIIASPEGDIIINENAPPELASAGTGDVLAGMIAGLLAQQILSPLDCAAAACYLHSMLGARLGSGLIASDLVDSIPQILNEKSIRL